MLDSLIHGWLIFCWEGLPDFGSTLPPHKEGTMNSLRKRSSVLLILGFGLVAALLLGSSPAMAGTITQNVSLNLARTNWTNSFTINQFDPSVGCLDSVCFSLAGHVEGSAAFESRDSGPTTVLMDLAATITLQRPDSTLLVATIPLAHTSDNVTAFDGVIDFGGTSGRTYAALQGDKTEGNCTSLADDKTLFTGTGTLVLPVVAVGSSGGSGGGSLLLSFTTDASAGAVVTYYYSTCPVPAQPATWGSVKALYR